MRTDIEAAEYFVELRMVLRYLGVTNGNTQEESLCCNVNASIRPAGQLKFGTKVVLDKVSGRSPESPERTECKDGGSNLVKSDEGNVVNFTGSLVQEDCVKSVEKKLSTTDDSEVNVEEEDEMFDDDWQGVETTELERRFGVAVSFMDAKVNSGVVNLIDNEVKVELYGLHRVAIEGSCFEPQPMALKVSARANWYKPFRYLLIQSLIIYLNIQRTEMIYTLYTKRGKN
ncbi:putative acyl-CoA-binding protein, ACBP [Helianthus anomalus]